MASPSLLLRSNGITITGGDQNWIGSVEDVPRLNTPESFRGCPAPGQNTARMLRKGYDTSIVTACPGALAPMAARPSCSPVE
jgi:hypothetical protein